MKLVAVNGSPRKYGNTRILLETVLAELELAGIGTEIIDIGGVLWRGCQGCSQCAGTEPPRCLYNDDPFNDCVAKVLSAQALILGTPVYTSDVTASMKAFIERAASVRRRNGNLMKYKVGAGIVVARRAGFLHAFDTLNHFFLNGHMIVPGSSYWNMAVGFEPGDVKKDLEGLESLRDLAQNIAYLLTRLYD